MSTQTVDYESSKSKRIIQIVKAQLLFLRWIVSNRKSRSVLFFYTPQWIDSLAGLVLAKLLNYKTVIDQTDLHSLRRHRLLHITEEFVVSRCSDRLALISDYLVNHFAPFVPAYRLIKLPIIVDHSRFELNVAKIPFLIGYVGSFGDKDGLDIMLSGFRQSLNQYPKLKLRLIGAKNKTNPIASILRDLKLENHVEVWDEVSYDDIPSLLLACDTFIMNRKHTPFAMSGYPTKLGEYFAARGTVIMSENDYYAQDYRHLHEVIKYQIDDSVSLSNAINWRYSHYAQADEIANNGYLHATQRFNHLKVGADFYEQLKSITSES